MKRSSEMRSREMRWSGVRSSFYPVNLKDSDSCSYVNEKCSRKDKIVGAGESGRDK